jgi:SAM-dependent methyltransferase
MIPFQLHRRLPLIRRPFDQRDDLVAENAKLKAQLAEAHRALDTHHKRVGRRLSRTQDLKSTYAEHVERLKSDLPVDEAMKKAISGDFGGDFDVVGRIELAVLRHCGLLPTGHVIDVGCGSGRLAVPLSSYLTGTYSGFDVVDDLIDFARGIVKRPDWRFEVIDHIGIPEPDKCADMVCFFSVMTHLLHEQSYWYLEEAKRVLKPEGTIVISFLEFNEPIHWPVFRKTLEHAKGPQVVDSLNVFIERSVLRVWAESLDLEIMEMRDGTDEIGADGPLGQSLCVMRRRA